jgi:flavoprotein
MRSLGRSGTAENHSTWDNASTMICVMFRYAFLLAASAVADATKAAVPVFLAAVDGARS